MCTSPFIKDHHYTARGLWVPHKRNDLKINMAYSTQGDQPIRSPELSNRHVSFCWLLGHPILWLPSLHTAQCGTPIHAGYLSLGEGDGHMASLFSHLPTHLLLVLGWGGWAHGITLFPSAYSFVFQGNGPGPVHGTSPFKSLKHGQNCGKLSIQSSLVRHMSEPI
jgi:hypothetical protein